MTDPPIDPHGHRMRTAKVRNEGRTRVFEYPSKLVHSDVFYCVDSGDWRWRWNGLWVGNEIDDGIEGELHRREFERMRAEDLVKGVGGPD